jgi:energy-converting hydrogenase Eha subunit H
MTPKTREQFEKVAKVVGENSRISSNFALVCVLADNGGIMIDDYFAITEPM